MKRGNIVNYRPNYRNHYTDRRKTSAQSQVNNSVVNRMSAANNQTTTGGSNTAGFYNLEEMITYIRENPNVAFGIHQQLTHAPHQDHLNAPMDSSTPQTPKRILDTSENNGTQVSKQQRVLPNGKQSNRNQTSVSIIPSQAKAPNNNNAQQAQAQEERKQEHRITFEQLKRAVASNLPCFLIEYEQTENMKDRPSDVSAASFIVDHFRHQGIAITFSLVGHMGNKLKLGVNNKEAYATLISTDKWPAQINSINIKVIKPKFIPDSFALVARYVPLQYNDDYVKEEIGRNLQSAENIRRIQYRFERRSNDFRFIVKDLREYNTTLKLGRISIGNSLCTITPFLAGNRMTYCTRCWCVGHLREKCNLQRPRCRICLASLIDGQNHECSNIARCAQCDGSHHSLSSECEKVIQYRADLKEQVNNALSTGKLKRLLPHDHNQQTQFQLNQNDFQPLPQPLMPAAAPWRNASIQPSAAANSIGNEDITKMLVSLNQNIVDMKEYWHRIEGKMDRLNGKTDQITLDTELHYETLTKLLPLLLSIIQDFIWPMTSTTFNAAKLEKQQPTLQKYYNSMELILSHLNTDYTSRRKRSMSPPPRLSPTEQLSESTNANQTIGSDQNMSK